MVDRVQNCQKTCWLCTKLHTCLLLLKFLFLMLPWCPNFHKRKRGQNLLHFSSLEDKLQNTKSDCYISKRLLRTLEFVVWNNTWEKYSEFDTSRDICKLLHRKVKFKDLLDWLNDRHILDFLNKVFLFSESYFHSACLPAFIADVLWQGEKLWEYLAET